VTARHVVGIDLGTTHCAVAVAPIGGDASTDTAGGGAPEVLAIPQLAARATLESRPLLPSFLYFAHESEGAQALPWDAGRTYAVGEYARSRGLDAPLRLVSSAKSWLSHAGIDRRAGTLPLGAPVDVEKVSPVEASFRYLQHIAEAYDSVYAAGRPELALAEQEVVLTVPASFDAAARELTVEAATAAGLERLTLLEEPQSALYAWIASRGQAWRQEVRAGDVILVIDIGGGTTDFSAIAAVESDGALELVRVAVGDHILLGGDNMDLALAYRVRQKLESGGKEIDRWQMNALTHACRHAKERMLNDAGVSSVPVTVAGRGSNLLGAGLRTELTKDELATMLLDGFFPEVESSARPAPRARGALTQMGLPYASDAAITKHLASFLGRQAGATSKLAGFAEQRPTGAALLHPTALLFNGGVLKGEAIRQRIVDMVNGWLEADGGSPVRLLGSVDLDLAVAKGAAAYGIVKRGRGLRIRGGTARAYYVGIESPAPAVPGVEPPVVAFCLAPFGMEEGTVASLPPHEVGVVVGESVRFRFFGSTVRRDDREGTELERWATGELEELSPIEVVLPAEGRTEGEIVPVKLHASVTEVGTLLLEAVPTQPRKANERWRIELSVRSGG
jgi:hypothetical protein